MKDNINILNVIKIAGAFIAFIIGSGFATGQEIMQFFTSNGLYSLVSILIYKFFRCKSLDCVYKLKLFSSNKKSYKLMLTMPFSSLCGLITSLTIIIFLKESLILRRELFSCLIFESLGKLYADCI